MAKWFESLLNIINTPPFRIGDTVRFEPDERAIGWTQDLKGLYPGYVGKVTRLVRGKLWEGWGVYVDDIDIDFLSIYFRLVKKASK